MRSLVLLAAFALGVPAHADLADLRLEEVVDLFDPVFVTHAGDDRLFVVRLFGQVLILEDGALRPEPFVDISDRVGRIFSIAFHPDYAVNGFVFFHRVERGTRDSLITRFRRSASDPNRLEADSEVVLLRIPKALNIHYGGTLAFGPDGYLYVSTGDTNDVTADGELLVDPECAAQSLDRLEGKVLRLDVDRSSDAEPFYGVPPDNPFVDSRRPEIWAYGLRNPWRFSFDRETGDLWIGDVGLDDREEVNFQAAASPGGQNYGWKVMEGTSCYGDTSGCTEPMPACGAAGLTPPALEYPHLDGKCAVVGGMVYRGSLVPDLYGLYVYGDLCTGTLWAAQRRDGGWTTRQLALTLPGVASFGEDVRGEIYLMAEGGAHRLVDPTVPAAGLIEFAVTRSELTEGVASAQVVLRRVGGTAGDVSVTVRRSGGTADREDFPFDAGTIRWADGEGDVRKFEVPVVDDAVDEPDETIVLRLESPAGGAELGARTTAEYRIVDDDEPLCVPDANRLCLTGGRFRVSVSWRTGEGLTGSGVAVPQGADSGSFWFFSPGNPEVFVKVLDACFEPFNAYWVFAAGLTDVETSLVVTDMATGAARRYDRPLGVSYEAVRDTSAFATCP